jgi:hypothetical protein
MEIFVGRVFLDVDIIDNHESQSKRNERLVIESSVDIFLPVNVCFFHVDSMVTLLK